MLNPDDNTGPIDTDTGATDPGSGSTGTGTGSGSGSAGTGATTGSGGFWNAVIGVVGKSQTAGTATATLTIDPANPLTYNTRYNPATDQIEVLDVVTGNWIPVTVVGKKGSKVDLSLFSSQELQSYLKTGEAIPAVPKVKKLTANTTPTTNTKTKVWVWVLVAVGIGGLLFGVWKIAKKRQRP